MNRTKGFTLIELLIVVAIIAILAAIAVPNFLEAQTRARVSRVDNDLRTISLVMESYRIDNNGYVASDAHSWLPGHGTAIASDQRLLSTPIAYIDDMPDDIFRIVAGQSKPNYRVYVVGLNSLNKPDASAYPHVGYMTWSQGPDTITQQGSYRSFKTVLENEAAAAISGNPGSNGIRYDPTNGTISLGDIYRFDGISKSM